ncbi:ATP-binding cassette domain-containing protein [Pseudarthrobacter sp. NPDC058329]|uniref:ATP-binding cassette domain-containing protein n=1 Tax=Pseudarthrobacter sp. NPDC058329 TaxID=3346448 RepID=UPI0036DB0E21
MPAPVLSVNNLALTSAGRQLVHPLSFSIQHGECVALLGGSGSGKSLTAAALTGTVPEGMTVSGEISFATRPAVADRTAAGRTVAGWTAAGRTAAAPSNAALIHQDPQTSLNPLVPLGKQLLIPLRKAGLSRADALNQAARFLAQAGIEEPAVVLPRYTGELSGGQLQRVCVALALACGSTVLVADEPTTALDAVTRLKVLTALRAWGTKGRGLLFITHDLIAAASLCSRALVIEDGRIVEKATMDELLRNPRHPFTRRLIRSSAGTAPLAVPAEPADTETAVAA